MTHEIAMISYAFAETTLGLALLAGSARGLCFLQFGESEAELLHFLKAEFPHATLSAAGASSVLDGWKTALTEYFSTSRLDPSLTLDERGTAFQREVWRHLRLIPAGTTCSYTQLAQSLGRPSAVRAVAAACARNRIAIAIPCHRVVRGNGALAGYRWGMARKQALIDLERQA